MKLFLLKCHRWLAFIFSLPLIILAVTGIIMSLKPESLRDPKPTSFSAPASVARSLQQLLRERPGMEILRINYTPNKLILMVKDSGMKLLEVNRQSGNVTETDPMSDPFVVSKIIHESLLLKKPGKILVAISGAGLFFILLTGLFFWWKKKFWASLRSLMQLEQLKRLKQFHIALGVITLLPLLFSAATGFLIELNWLFYSDKKPLEHVAPKTCEWNQQIALIEQYATQSRGMIQPCRRDFPYLTFSQKETSRQFTPEGLEVLTLTAADWSGSGFKRKHFFVHLHGGDDFGVFKTPYRLLIGLSLVILIVSGLVLFMKRKKIFRRNA